ncbi:MAG: HEAT repeat domain-containing protein [Candidatus Sulfotelmatobacter sp.]
MNQLNGLQPQKQAETLLELAIGDSSAANQEIAQRVGGWRGKLSLDAQLGTLTAAALNSNDLQVRQSGIEVQLAAYGLAKNSSTVEFLIQNASSSGHAQKIWALWALGALANRGVESARVERALMSHLKDADEDSRSWAVEGLSLAGTTTTIAPLLEVMRDDPSPAVRERAAGSLAESGMLSHEQRLAAVPQLVNYTEDASLDSQTHAWVFQALGDITKVRLPNDPAAWRNWYASANGKE